MTIKTSVLDIVSQYHLTREEYDVLVDENDNEYLYFEKWENGEHKSGTFSPITKDILNDNNSVIYEFNDMYSATCDNRYIFNIYNF